MSTGAESGVFRIPARHAAKAEPAVIGADEVQFAEIARALEAERTSVARRLAEVRRRPGGRGQAALERDLEVHRLTARLRVLGRYSVDACLGRTVADDGERMYIGRFGLSDADGRRVLVDWRTPAAEPYFAATPAHPMGLASRRRYRWRQGAVTDYWDEVLAGVPDAATVALDADSAFTASLGGSRSARMRDVLSTIQADQDAIIRSDAHGALVVDGGPGTGKTVVALHRTAYLQYADTRLGEGRGGVLFVGPHEPYLAYVSDVLPSLGEEGVQTCTIRSLVAEGDAAGPETDPARARLKASARWADAIDAAVALYEEPPTALMIVETPWAAIRLDPADWADAFASPEPGTAHNDARDQVWERLLEILADRLSELVDPHDAPPHRVRRALAGNTGLARAFQRAWPLVEAAVVVSDLWSVPAYLRRCAPWLGADEVRMLQREDPRAWTVADLPLLDAARQRLGDPQAPQRRRQREAQLAAQRREMAEVIEQLVAAGDEIVTWMDGDDLRASLEDESALPTANPDVLAGPFAHIVVDEAQELTDAEWGMLLARCPSRSFTIVGDRAQARHGFAESWRERLERVGFTRISLAALTVNYRTPSEVMVQAEPVIRAAIPDANVPVAIRSSGIPVVRGESGALRRIVDEWLSTHAEGVACVIGDPGFAASERVQSLSPELAKGLEFDLVVLVDPDRFGDGIEGAVDRYVAMTRATERLVILSRG